MNNNNIVKIGTALKWRSTFDISKKYYQENIVTACGCVFRCKVLQAQGKSPIQSSDEAGHIIFANTDVWDVIVDMAYYYNFAIDTNQHTTDTLAYVKSLDEAIQKQQNTINGILKDDENQWEAICSIIDENIDQWDVIRDIQNLDEKQQREIDSIIDSISCYSEGVWFDSLLWNNNTLWDNNKYALTDSLQEQINDLTITHQTDVKNLTDEIRLAKDDCKKRIEILEKQQEETQNTDERQQAEIDSLLHRISLVSNGSWDNVLLWVNDSEWSNSGFGTASDEALEALKRQIDENKSVIVSHEQYINDCYDKIGINQSAILDCQSDQVDADERISALERNMSLLMMTVQEQSKTITLQKEQLDIILDCFNVVNIGQWHNSLLWNNGSKWSDFFITEQFGGSSSGAVSVVGYDYATETVSIGLTGAASVLAYDQQTQTVTM